MIANFFALSATLFWIAFASPINTRDFIPPSGLAQFQLTTVPNGDNETYSGRFPTSIHTGAGESIAILTPNQNETTTWQFNATSGDVYFTTGSGAGTVPWSLGFADSEPYMSDAPAGYKIVTVDVGFADAGFSFEGDVLPNPSGRGTMAACYVNATAPYFSGGPQVQLLWRPDDVPAGDCADVLFQAISAE